MKIAITVFYDIRELEGTGLQALRIAEFMRKRHRVTIISGTNKSFKPSKITEILIVRICAVAIRALLWNLRLIYSLLKNNYDTVYCSNDYLGFTTIYLISKIRKYKIAYEAHGIMAEEFKEQHYPKILVDICESLEKSISKHANYIVALAPNILQYFHTHSSKPDNVELLHIFVDDSLFVPTDKDNEVSNLRLIGMIGPFDSPRKSENLHFLYDNLDRFDGRIHFVIIGHCGERISSQRIEYTGYLDSMAQYAICLSHLDAVLIPETIATTGPLNKIIQPMSCAIPVFTTPKGIIGLSRIETGRDIFVFEAGQLVDKVNELIFNNEIMRAVGKNARKVVEQYYSKKANAEKLEKIVGYLEIVVKDSKLHGLRDSK
jgi:glycosyltransferase involved in cell wall biosynthesis